MHERTHSRLGDRSGFSRLEARAYLAHAAVAPLSDDVVRVMQAGLFDAAQRGLGAIGPLIEAAELARVRFAELIAAQANEVACVPSTSAGISAFATGLVLEAGDRIVCFEGEFPTNVTPWQAVARRCGGSVEFASLSAFERSHEEGLAALDRVLERGARVVAASAVQFQTGLALPLAAIAERAHAAGALFFVDAIQAVGVAPLDVHACGIDALAAAGHKWLMGPLGAAHLFLSPGARAALDPLQVGWTSHVAFDAHLNAPGELRYDRPLVDNARVFEQGVLPYVNHAGSAAAMGVLIDIGVDQIAAHVQRYHDAIEPLFVALGCRSRRSRELAGRSGILAFEPPRGCSARTIVDGLARQGVVATAPDGLLRLAPHWPNALDEVEFVATAFDRALRDHSA